MDRRGLIGEVLETNLLLKDTVEDSTAMGNITL
jgi:hypothetical protein